MSAAGRGPNLAGAHSGWPMCSDWIFIGRRSFVHLRQDVAERPENGVHGLLGKYAAGKYAAQCEGDVVIELERAGKGGGSRSEILAPMTCVSTRLPEEAVADYE